MRIAVFHPQTPFVRGGAETHAESVDDALREAGHEAEEVVVAGKWYPATELVHQMAVWRAGALRIERPADRHGDRAEVPRVPHPPRAQGRLVDPSASKRVRAPGPSPVRRPRQADQGPQVRDMVQPRTASRSVRPSACSRTRRTCRAACGTRSGRRATAVPPVAARRGPPAPRTRAERGRRRVPQPARGPEASVPRRRGDAPRQDRRLA